MSGSKYRTNYDDKLKNYSARELCNALYLTTRDDLIGALGAEDEELWSTLVEISRYLELLNFDQLFKIMDLQREEFK